MDEQTNDSILAGPLASLRQEMAQLNTPRYVEKDLLQAFAAQFPRKPRWWERFATPQWSLAGSFASVALVVLVFGLSGHGPQLHSGSVSAPLVSRDGGGVFIALDTAERIEAEPAPRMIEAEVPRTMLAGMGVGVSITPENAGDQIKAEMLVGSDGAPLAVRLTSVD
ncbi:hypothetical protein GCM10027321_35650 [Massilia terrae]|uniref:Anti-sigma factor n=1 Tax=Massilia terrae TaxID=1811224 RepID=A0ABT2D431_9BURK|nr:hypothetical protein [Massilia terrae]MCS0661003.1 hypothetical protein [Massilia terrae]